MADESGLGVTERKAELERWREREAAVCPEDVPFDEYIGALLKRLAQQEAQIAELGSALLDVQRYALDFGHNHAPSHAGHECRLCWICKRVAAALSAPAGEMGGGT